MKPLFSKKSEIRIRVAAVITNSKKEILLLRQMKHGRSYWLLPGGGIEESESAIRALKRELKEELSLSVKKANFLAFNECVGPKGKRHIIQMIFGVKTKKGLPALNKDEKAVLEFRYFSMKSLKNIEIRPDCKKFLQRGKFKPSPHIESKWIE